jgi:hypothetical protein
MKPTPSGRQTTKRRCSLSLGVGRKGVRPLPGRRRRMEMCGVSRKRKVLSGSASSSHGWARMAGWRLLTVSRRPGTALSWKRSNRRRAGGVGEDGGEQVGAPFLQTAGDGGGARVVQFGGVMDRVGFEIPGEVLAGFRVERRREGRGGRILGCVFVPEGDLDVIRVGEGEV